MDLTDVLGSWLCCSCTTHSLFRVFNIHYSKVQHNNQNGYNGGFALPIVLLVINKCTSNIRNKLSVKQNY